MTTQPQPSTLPFGGAEIVGATVEVWKDKPQTFRARGVIIDYKRKGIHGKSKKFSWYLVSFPPYGSQTEPYQAWKLARNFRIVSHPTFGIYP